MPRLAQAEVSALPSAIGQVQRRSTPAETADQPTPARCRSLREVRQAGTTISLPCGAATSPQDGSDAHENT